VFEKDLAPEQWAAAARKLGYGAAYCPVNEQADDATVRAYAEAARKAGLVIAEVGAWSNPISPDEETRRKAVKLCQDRLALAERIGANCCVNIAGSCGAKWDGPDPADLTDATFDLIVESVRGIIDAVRPTRACYTLETMPWMYPDSADSYVRLVAAIDRERFAVHMDPVNLVNCPQRYFRNAELLRECFRKLGPRIRSCHAKDILLDNKLTVHLSEVPPGKGGLDYAQYVRLVESIGPDTPLMMEHMKQDDYGPAGEHIRSVAARAGVVLR